MNGLLALAGAAPVGAAAVAQAAALLGPTVLIGRELEAQAKVEAARC